MGQNHITKAMSKQKSSPQKAYVGSFDYIQEYYGKIAVSIRRRACR
jgi:hypothetical protein